MERHESVVFAACLLFLSLCLWACSTSPNEAGGSRLRTPHAPPPSRHRDVTGEAAEAVFVALGEAVSQSHDPPSEYDVSELICHALQTPYESINGFRCDLTVRSGQGKPTKVMLRDVPTSSGAEHLFAALQGAGARIAQGKGGASVSLHAVKARKERLTFDDDTDLPRQPPPNVEHRGPAARRIVHALTTAHVEDEDGSLMLFCSRFESNPACEFSLRGAHTTKLDPTQSGALWHAFLEGLRSLATHGAASLEHVTFLHASGFTYDGTTLRLFSMLASGSPPSTPLAEVPWPVR
jgi:hypothetical protein